MKKLIYILLAAILIQTSHAEDKIKISINKDQNGRITLVSSGHSTPISFDIMGKSYDVPAGGGSVEIESDSFDIETAAGEQSKGNPPAVVPPIALLIPPVTSAVNPPLATPIGSD